MAQPCQHNWQPDPDNVMFEECRFCHALRRVSDNCPVCMGRKWVDAFRFDDEGYRHPYRAPCGYCGATGLVPLDPPKLL